MLFAGERVEKEIREALLACQVAQSPPARKTCGHSVKRWDNGVGWRPNWWDSHGSAHRATSCVDYLYPEPGASTGLVLRISIGDARASRATGYTHDSFLLRSLQGDADAAS